MRVLAVDTSTPLGSIALLESGRLCGEIALAGPRSHSRRLLGMARSLLEAAGWKAGEIELFVATRGPGSFTGLRVGLATVRGLALAAGRPAAGVSSLLAMASALGGPGIPVAPILDAGRGELYACVAGGEDPPRALRDEALVAPGDLPDWLGRGPMLALGCGLDRNPSLREPLEQRGIRVLGWQGAIAGAAGRLAARLLESGRARPEDLPLTARYIRRSDARLPGRN